MQHLNICCINVLTICIVLNFAEIEKELEEEGRVKVEVMKEKHF